MEKVRLTNETQLQDIRRQIDDKLKSADEKRDEILKQLQEKLRLHVEFKLLITTTWIDWAKVKIIAGRTY